MNTTAIIVGLVVVLLLLWFFVLRKKSSKGSSSKTPSVDGTAVKAWPASLKQTYRPDQPHRGYYLTIRGGPKGEVDLVSDAAGI